MGRFLILRGLMANAPRVERKKITDFQQDGHNANAGTEAGLRALDDSMAEAGLGRSILVDKNGVIIAGNKSQERAVDRGFENAIVVHTTGNELVVVQRDDLDIAEEKARKLAYADNRVAQLDLNWDVDQLLKDMEAGIPLDDLFPTIPDIPDIDPSADIPLARHDVPDALWPSDNEWGVPLLDIAMQADAVDLPIAIWGASDRKRRMNGTYLFYTEDYRFEALWDDPTGILNSKCVNAGEVNFSAYQDMPRAVALWGIYRKRWLARYWQSKGVRIFVDLNVNERHADINLLGVPTGWKAYCTRGYVDRLESTDFEYRTACERAGSESILFVVYGGGKAVEKRCKERGWIWSPEDRDIAKLRANG